LALFPMLETVAGLWRKKRCGTARVNKQACDHLSPSTYILKGAVDYRLAPVVLGSSRNAVVSTRAHGPRSVDEETERKMHAHPRSRCHLRPSIFKLTSLWAEAQFGFAWMFEVRWRCSLTKQKRSQTSWIKICLQISRIDFSGKCNDWNCEKILT